MAEIRNLTRNGETFYPLTTSSAVINESTGEGYVIDEVPTAGSENLVKSGGVFNSSLETKKKINMIKFNAIDSKDDKITIKNNNEELIYTEITSRGIDSRNEEIEIVDNRGNHITEASFSNSLNEYEEIEIVDKNNNTIFELSKEGIKVRGLFSLNGNPLDKSVFSSISMIQKLGVCGDSYAQGSIALSNPDRSFTREDLSWGKVLGRIYGIDVTLFAKGGASVSTYIETSNCLPKLLNTEAQELYAVSLGHNDMFQGTSVGNITTRGTFMGDYAYIIDQIQLHAPHAMIILLRQSKPYCEMNNGTELNNAISALGEHYGLPVFDPNDDEYLSSSVWVETMSRNHPVFTGYAGLALAFARQFSYHTVIDWEYFMRFGTDLI